MTYLFKLFEMFLLALSIDPSWVACIIDVLWPYIMGFWILLASTVFSLVWKYCLTIFFSTKNYMCDLFGFDISAESSDDKSEDEDPNWLRRSVIIVVASVVFTIGWMYLLLHLDCLGLDSSGTEVQSKSGQSNKPVYYKEFLGRTKQGISTYKMYEIDPQTRIGTCIGHIEESPVGETKCQAQEFPFTKQF